MSVNEYITKFTQLSRYTPHEVDTDEKKHVCFLNGLNDGLAYALEVQDFENIQGMEHKCKLVHQHQRGCSSRPVLLCFLLDLCSVLLSHSFSQGCRQLDKDSLPHNVK
jgi:hypothetical protein